MSSSPPRSPHWLLFFAAVHPASQQQLEWQARHGRACSGPELASIWSERWCEPAVLSSHGALEDCSLLCFLCVLLDCDLRTLLVSFAACVVRRDCPGRCRVSAPAKRHMIYFRAKDVGIQRGHIYSLLVWWEDLPVKADSEKEARGTENWKSFSLYRGHGWMLFSVGCSE